MCHQYRDVTEAHHREWPLCPLQPHCINVDLQTSIKLCKAHSRHEDIVYANVDA